MRQRHQRAPVAACVFTLAIVLQMASIECGSVIPSLAPLINTVLDVMHSPGVDLVGDAVLSGSCPMTQAIVGLALSIVAWAIFVTVVVIGTLDVVSRAGDTKKSTPHKEEKEEKKEKRRK